MRDCRGEIYYWMEESILSGDVVDNSKAAASELPLCRAPCREHHFSYNYFDFDFHEALGLQVPRQKVFGRSKPTPATPSQKVRLKLQGNDCLKSG